VDSKFSTGNKSVKNGAASKKSALDWQMRCTNCGFTKPWSEHGFRLKDGGRKYAITGCLQCHRLHMHAIEPASTAPV